MQVKGKGKNSNAGEGPAGATEWMYEWGGENRNQSYTSTDSFLQVIQIQWIKQGSDSI